MKGQPYKMGKHTQIILCKHSTNCLSVFDHFVGLALKELNTCGVHTEIILANFWIPQQVFHGVIEYRSMKFRRFLPKYLCSGKLIFLYNSFSIDTTYQNTYSTTKHIFNVTGRNIWINAESQLQVNNNDTRTTSVTMFCYLYC